MKRFYYIIIFAVLMSCQEEVSFESGNRPLLIVDGFITDAPRTHTVRLATSGEFESKFNGGLEDPVVNASVSIESRTEETIQLFESRPGFYDTPIGYQATVGETYVLCITTQEDKYYQSQPQKLKSSGSMGNVYYEVTTEEVLNPANIIVPERRINFYSNFSFPEENTFYKWEWDGMYVLKTTYFGNHGYPDIKCKESPLDVAGIVEFCYVEENPDGGFIRILDSNLSTSMDNEKFLILSKKVDYNWKMRYSMRLFQLSMTEAAYDFWEDVQEQKERSGSIFDPAPSKVTGNVYNVSNGEEDVLGYFGVYGSREVRVFVPGVPMPDSFNSCLIPLLLPDEKHPAYCCDCRAFDTDRSKPYKPDFWIDG